jgi:hypothetical protein
MDAKDEALSTNLLDLAVAVYYPEIEGDQEAAGGVLDGGCPTAVRWEPVDARQGLSKLSKRQRKRIENSIAPPLAFLNVGLGSSGVIMPVRENRLFYLYSHLTAIK